MSVRILLIVVSLFAAASACGDPADTEPQEPVVGGPRGPQAQPPPPPPPAADPGAAPTQAVPSPTRQSPSPSPGRTPPPGFRLTSDQAITNVKAWLAQPLYENQSVTKSVPCNPAIDPSCPPCAGVDAQGRPQPAGCVKPMRETERVLRRDRCPVVDREGEWTASASVNEKKWAVQFRPRGGGVNSWTVDDPTGGVTSSQPPC